MSGHFASDVANTFKYMGLTVVKPKVAFEELIKDSRQHIYAIYAFILINVIYTALCFIGGIFTTVEPKIPFVIRILGLTNDKMYMHIAWIFIPVMIIMYLSAYAAMEMGGMFTKSADNFKATFSTTTFAFTMPMWSAFICDSTVIIGGIILKYTVIPVWGIVVIDVFFAIMGVWTAILLPMCAIITKKMKLVPGIITGIASALVWWAIMVVFVL